MLLAVSGIVHATPSFETVAALIGVAGVLRVLTRPPFGSVHGIAAAAAGLEEPPPRVAKYAASDAAARKSTKSGITTRRTPPATIAGVAGLSPSSATSTRCSTSCSAARIG